MRNAQIKPVTCKDQAVEQERLKMTGTKWPGKKEVGGQLGPSTIMDAKSSSQKWGERSTSAAERASKYPTDFTIRELPVTLRKRNFNGRRKRRDGEPNFTVLGNE